MITVGQVIQTLADVVAERPEQGDARVRRKLAPRYIEHGAPCCLVAVVLNRLGFTVAQLRQLDTEPGTSGGGVVFSESRHPLVKRIEPQARTLLDYLQRRQDQSDENWSRIADRALQRGEFAPQSERGRPCHFDGLAGRWAYQAFSWNVASEQETPAI